MRCFYFIFFLFLTFFSLRRHTFVRSHKTRHRRYVVDSYIPVPKELLPSAFTTAGVKARWHRFGQTVRSTIAVALVKRAVPSFAPIPFAVEAQNQLIKTNKALARYQSGLSVKLSLPFALTHFFFFQAETRTSCASS